MIVEYAIILPLTILLSIGLTDLGRLFWTVQDSYRVTAQTARCGAIDTKGNCPNLVGYANSIDFPMDTVTYTATTTTCGTQPAGNPQSGVSVTATINFNFLIYGPASLNNFQITTCYAKSI